VQLAESIAARNAAVKKRDDSLVGTNPAALQMAQLESDRLSREVQLLEFRIENLVVRSPIDGVVLTGNLERSEGVPVTAGQKLFEVAPLAEMVVEIAIPETEVRHVTPGMEVKLRLESESGRVWDSTLEGLHPISEVKDGTNVFIGEATLENEDGELRPGMKGSIRVITERKPIGWIAFHRVWEYLRLKIW
ncbi:MAG: HlyD family efflux transporter periplasmic adaptor subunit, partial [Verrucomicrobiota bacterium]